MNTRRDPDRLRPPRHALRRPGPGAVRGRPPSGPAAGSLVTLSTLLGLVVLSAFAFSPWPRWWTLHAESARLMARPRPPPCGSNPHAPPAAEPPALKHRDPVGGPHPRGESWLATFADELERGSATGRRRGGPRWRWPAWVALAFLVGLAIGLLRLCWDCGRCMPCAEGPAGRRPLVARCGRPAPRGDVLHRPVEVRESPEISAPATIGWRRPRCSSPTTGEAGTTANGGSSWPMSWPTSAGVTTSPASGRVQPRPALLPSRGTCSQGGRLQQELAADAWGARLVGATGRT
ncbi:MAG: hypothetical protein WKF75_10840 [Singulisphaera sp.]